MCFNTAVLILDIENKLMFLNYYIKQGFSFKIYDLCDPQLALLLLCSKLSGIIFPHLDETFAFSSLKLSKAMLDDLCNTHYAKANKVEKQMDCFLSLSISKYSSPDDPLLEHFWLLKMISDVSVLN